MDRKLKFFLIFFVAIILIPIGIFYVNSLSNPYDQNSLTYKPGAVSEIDQAVTKAILLYQQKKSAGVDLSYGPCLSNNLMPNWVADIVHSPRIPADNLPQNQCSAYLEGKAKHFVELDTDGKLVRVH